MTPSSARSLPRAVTGRFRMRLTASALALAVAAGLAGCTAGPRAVEAAELHELLLAALPTAEAFGEGVEHTDGDALDSISLNDESSYLGGGDITDSAMDFDARVVASAYREAVSPGWSDSSLGPAYVVGLYAFRLDSAEAVRDFVTVHHQLRDEVYRYTDPAGNDGRPGGGEVLTTFTTATQPTKEYLPEGAFERRTRHLWPEGSRAVGIAAWVPQGDQLVIVTAISTPDTDSRAGLDEVMGELVPGMLDALEGLRREVVVQPAE